MKLLSGSRRLSRARLQCHSFYVPHRYSSTKACDPLRILFCGSDDFSSASLRAVHDEQVRRPDAIASIDVACRPGKRSGRGLKTIREAPIKHVADSLSLPVHELDTFTGWTLPEPSHATTCINLIIAVSFGLFVPPRILRPARYGGLNVHPSLLPESVLPHPRIHLWGFTDIFTTHSFRGAAPLHHTLLAGRPKTGVTVQTLHPARFDHGVVLAQTPYPGFDVSEHCTVSELRDLCAPAGAQLLVQTLRGRLFVPPLQDVGWFCGDPDADGAKFPLAPKITPEDRHVRWDAWTADVIITRERVLGGIWAVAGSSDSPSLGRRVVMHGFREVRDATPWSITVGRFYLAGQDDSPSLRVGTCDGKALEIQELTIEGKPRMSAARAAKHAHLLGVAWQ